MKTVAFPTRFNLSESANFNGKPPQGTVLFINLLGKGLTPMACMGDGRSI